MKKKSRVYDIKITIHGKRLSGKSTLARVIGEILHQHNVDVIIKDRDDKALKIKEVKYNGDNEDVDVIMDKDEERLESISNNNIKVLIECKNIKYS